MRNRFGVKYFLVEGVGDFHIAISRFAIILYHETGYLRGRTPV